ncbi:uncharacterized protein SCHCODRAFT_01205355 [Schizophyllum commune H4-8]|nr:uncharacterized protein SCHCODRAFT_01205355 [Schizophyllum commune H4-8]KAI5887175.1 hypothetical protein SCHCODRAFT_01205355 [Schizophyllum commune H4-8]
MSIRVFSTSRLAITAGLEVAPILSIGLPVILPADAIVRAVRCYDHDNSIILLWTPNQAEVAYCPGKNLNPGESTWPQQPTDLAARRVDGSFGRFDYAIYAQSWTRATCWAPAMIITPEGADGQYETLSVLPWWSDNRNARGGHVQDAALLALKARFQAVAAAYGPARARLASSSSFYIGPELLNAFPSLPSPDDWRHLLLSFRFEEAVDLWATYVRQLRSVEAAIHMANELYEYQVAGCPAATTCPSNAAQSNRLGVWANDVPPEWLQFYLYAGYKIYIAHKAEQDAMYPLDYCTITSEDWTEGDNVLEMDRNQWAEAAREEGWRLRSPPASASSVSASIAVPASESPSREAWSDPRNYGYVMGGEERRERLLPPAPASTTAISRSNEATPSSTAVTTADQAAAPPPAYSTLPDAHVATIEGADGVTYRMPPRGSRLYRSRLERVVIDPAHHPWLRPPPRQELGRGRSMEAFIPVEVTINGQDRTVFRRIGTRNSARDGFMLTQDYANRRNIYLPPSFRPPVGTVDEELWGFPAPVTFYFDLPNAQNESNILPPSIWLYPADRAARHLARPGAVPPRPSPSQLPRLHDELRRPLLNENPEDCTLPVLAEGEDDYMDEEDGDFYSMPVDDERRDPSPPPLPLYSATPQADEMVVESDHTPTQNAQSSASAPTHSATVRRSPPPAAPASVRSQQLSAGGHSPRPLEAAPQDHSRMAPPAAPSHPPAPLPRTDDGSSAARRNEGDSAPSSSRDARRQPGGRRDSEDSRARTRAEDASRRSTSSWSPAPASRSRRDDDSGWGANDLEATAADWRLEPRHWAGVPPTAPPPTSSVATLLSNGFLVIRHINRWVHATDLENAIRRLLDSMPGPRPRLLTAYGRNARPQTEQERRERRSSPFNFYLQFATEAEAQRVRQAMGHPWLIMTTNRHGEERGNRGIFRAYNIDFATFDEFRAVRSDPNAWVYPWQGLYDTASAPTVNPAGSFGGPATTAPPPAWGNPAGSIGGPPVTAPSPAWLSPAQQAAFGAAHAHSTWPFASSPFLPTATVKPYQTGGQMGPPFVMVPSGMLGAMYPPPPPPPTATPATLSTDLANPNANTSRSTSTSASHSPVSTGRSLASRLSSPSPDHASMSLLDRISDRDSDASDSRGRRRSRPRRRRGYSPPSYNEPGPSRRRSPPPPPAAAICKRFNLMSRPTALLFVEGSLASTDHPASWGGVVREYYT